MTLYQTISCQFQEVLRHNTEDVAFEIVLLEVKQANICTCISTSRKGCWRCSDTPLTFLSALKVINNASVIPGVKHTKVIHQGHTLFRATILVTWGFNHRFDIASGHSVY